MNRITVGSALGTYTPENGGRTITLSLGYVPTIEQLMYVYNITQDELYYCAAENLSKCTMSGSVITIDSSFAVLASTDKIHIQLDYPYKVATTDGQDALLAELQLKADVDETQPVSVASLPLPSGAATASNQIDGTQKTQLVDSAGDIADVIETNGSNGLVTISPGHVSTDNSTSTPLSGGATFTGTWEDITNFGIIVLTVKASHASATDGLVVEFSSDGTNIDSADNFTIPATTGKTFSFQAATKYFRVSYTNGATPQTYLRLQCILKPYYVKPSSHRITDAIIGEDDAELVKAVITGKNPAGNFVNFQATTSGNFKVSLEELESGVSDNSNTQLKTSMYGKTGDATFQVPRIDPSTHALECIDYVHHEIHGGSYFEYVNAQELTNGQTISFVVVTPDTAKYAHFGFMIEGESEFDLQMFETATPQSNGTLVSNPAVINANRNVSDVHTTLIYHTPTLGGGSKGTLIRRYHGGSGKASGGQAGSPTEIILKRNTKYWFDLNNATTSNNWLSWVVGWYEHTDKGV